MVQCMRFLMIPYPKRFSGRRLVTSEGMSKFPSFFLHSLVAGIFLALLYLASPVAADGIFSSQLWRWVGVVFCYIILFPYLPKGTLPDVTFKPGRFFMGDGWLGLLCNYMNYASNCYQKNSLIYFPFINLICVAVILLSSIFIIYFPITVGVVSSTLRPPTSTTTARSHAGLCEAIPAIKNWT